MFLINIFYYKSFIYCRIRIAKNVNIKSNTKLKIATGENPNEYYKINIIKKPIISDKSDLKGFSVPDTQLFYFDTNKNEIYFFDVK